MRTATYFKSKFTINKANIKILRAQLMLFQIKFDLKSLTKFSSLR